MQIGNTTTAIVPRSWPAPARRKAPQERTERRARLAAPSEFEALLNGAVPDFIEAEFEETVSRESGEGAARKPYLSTLFPSHAMKCFYVNYYA